MKWYDGMEEFLPHYGNTGCHIIYGWKTINPYMMFDEFRSCGKDGESGFGLHYFILATSDNIYDPEKKLSLEYAFLDQLDFECCSSLEANENHKNIKDMDIYTPTYQILKKIVLEKYLYLDVYDISRWTYISKNKIP